MMSVQKIENYIDNVLTGNSRKNALDFVTFLRANDMQFERSTGYWEDKRYWMLKYKDEYVCFILINGYGTFRHKDEPEGWVIWSETSDFSNSQWYEGAPLDESMKEIAWRNVDYCANCSPGSPCYGGMHKIIFGKEHDNVCRCTFRFDNPDAKNVECVKKLIEMRKNDIDFL